MSEKGSTAGDPLDDAVERKMSQVGETKVEEEVVVRAEWGNHIEFFLTSLGLAVGLGNIWRFPYVCFENGGGTFLIPYLIALFGMGLPLYFMEMILGQYCGASCTIIYRKIAPGLKGLGYGMLSINVIINFYYTVIMAWAFIYLFEGMAAELPWTKCDSDIGTPNCYSKPDVENCNVDETFYDFKCMNGTFFCQTQGLNYNVTIPGMCLNGTEEVAFSNVTTRVSPAEEFFNRYVLGLTEIGVVDTWENYGEPQWKVIGALALSWTVIALGLIKGVASYGKLSYFITLFPYVILTTFLIYVSQEDGFSDGVEFFLTPDWEKLAEADVWVAAVTQIFYSLGVGIGCQLLLSSYNGFNTNCHRDSWLIACCNSATSIYAGFVVFGTLGMLAHNQGVPIEAVVKQGTGLAFQAYPAAVTIMNPPQLFSFMFFFMLVLLAMSSISGSWEPVAAAIFDDFPKLRNHRAKVYFGCCLTGFLAGVSCCFPSGYFMFNLLDNHISTSVIYLAFVEVVTLAWFFGINNFMNLIDEMKVWMPRPMRYVYTFIWSTFIPIVLLFMVFSANSGRVADSTDGYEYPPGIQALGWMVELFPVIIPLALGLWTTFSALTKGDSQGASFLRTGPLLSPSSMWGPRPDRPRDEPVEGQTNAAADLDSEKQHKKEEV